MHPDHNTSQDVPLKICKKCGEAKSATEEFFSHDKSKPDGWHNYCKVCRASIYAANREHNAAYYAANRDRLRENARAWAAANPERKAKRMRAWRTANREHRAEYQRKWRANNREHTAEYDRTRRAANREHEAERMRAYFAANPGMRAANKRRRRARMRGAEGTHTAADIQAQYTRQKGRCFWCGEKVGDTYHVDHVVPLSRGGSNGPENLVIACPACNLRKHDKLPHEWPESGRLL